MRYRQSNVEETGSRRVKSLINSDDVLSTREQEEVLQHFAASLRSTNRFLILVAGLHLLLAMVYVGLLLAGYPLVGDFDRDAQGQAYQALTAYVPHARGDSAAGPHGGPHEMQSQDGSAVARLQQGRLSADQKKVMDYLEKRALHGTAGGVSQLGVGTVLATLASAGLLAAGGYASARAYGAMIVNVEELLQSEPRDLHARRPAGAAAADAAVPAEVRRQRLMEQCRRPVRFAASARAHVGLAAAALLPTLYWLTTLVVARRRLNAVYEQFDGLAGAITASVFDRVLELVLTVWQPLFHTFMGFVVSSMYDTRTQLIALSKLKYGFEKI